MVSQPINQGALHTELLPSTIWYIEPEIIRGFTLRIADQKADFGTFELALQMDVS
jgi:hypothetical protein